MGASDDIVMKIGKEPPKQPRKQGLRALVIDEIWVWREWHAEVGRWNAAEEISHKERGTATECLVIGVRSGRRNSEWT